ncbi:MAG TPA: hypothetical protein VHB48_02055 [Chitinophagaceae bacterium]|nr:hypothetical protein [Chitinophagaceae bacterium]
MNKFFFPVLTGLVLCCLNICTNAQQFSEHISKQFTPQKSAEATVLSIYNLQGSIKVEGYNGDKVQVEIDKTISAKDNNWLEIGKKEFQLGFDQQADTIWCYIAEPYDSRPHSWEYRNWNDSRRIEYTYTLEYTVKVPYNMNINVSTVNNGKVEVTDVAGVLNVHNVNGPITIKNAKNTTYAHTINGNLTVNYLSVPPGNSSYYTLNGTLSVTYPNSLSADLTFKSMNGGFYTDFDNVQVLPARVTKSVEKNDNGTTYKINKDNDIRIGSGGQTFHFETLNGNVYIKKQS